MAAGALDPLGLKTLQRYQRGAGGLVPMRWRDAPPPFHFPLGAWEEVPLPLVLTSPHPLPLPEPLGSTRLLNR